MLITAAIGRRLIWGTGIGLVLIAVIVSLLTFADTWAFLNPAKHCAPSFWQSQWPKYFGCAMAAHETLAGALWGGAGVLWAAWLAFQAVQEQITAERTAREKQQQADQALRRQQQSDAKRAAITCIRPALRGAATAMFIIDRALGNPNAEMATRVENILKYVDSILSSFTVREFVRDLGPDDRNIYLEIVGLLSTLLSVHTFGQSQAGAERCKVEITALAKVYDLLKTFDIELSLEFASACEFVPPPQPAATATRS